MTVRMVSEKWHGNILPYMNFYTPGSPFFKLVRMHVFLVVIYVSRLFKHMHHIC
jgi:hypothetical protein